MDEKTPDPLAPIDETSPSPDRGPQATPADHPGRPATAPDIDIDVTIPTVDRFTFTPSTWSPLDYAACGVHGESAKKLSESFIAPLVAASRGYASYNADQIDTLLSATGVNRRSAQARRIITAAARADVLVMPWFDTSEVVRAVTDIKPPDPTSIQFRPGILPPEEQDPDAQRKYEFITGHTTPIATHPAYPVDWIENTPVVLLAEGLLKGDAALTGYLLAHGATRAELSWTGDHDATATSRLRELLDRIPAKDRLCVLTIAGVWNWRQNPEWNSLRFNGRDVWLGIDGDVSEKPQVWRATRQLWDFIETKKKAKVHLLAPIVHTESSTSGTKSDKVGIDDYLAAHGDWSQLLECLTAKMPPPPQDAQFRSGDVRIDTDGASMSVFEVEVDRATGAPLSQQWNRVYDIGGRIRATLAERVPTDLEIITGRFGAGVAEAEIDWEVEIEVSFRGVNGEIEQHSITGPHHILNYLPEQWHSKGAHLPAAVTSHEAWPPRGKHAEGWVRAVKANAKDRTIVRTRWLTMGWVPVAGDIPAFIAGNHVIGGDTIGEEDVAGSGDEVIAGVTKHYLDRADAFGMGPDTGLTFDSDEYRESVRHAIETVIDTYVTNEVWNDRRNAAVVIAAGLRPAFPRRSKVIPYFTGARGTGKTYSAEAVMAFWAARPGSLIPLPGSAKDTAASMELADARAIAWVIDDLAPATSRRQSEDEKDKLGNLIRNHFNGTARGRSNANMQARAKNNPRSLLMITAENEPTVSSELDRIILCDIGHGALAKDTGPTDWLSAVVEGTVEGPEDGAPALVSQAMVKWLRWKASREGSSWEQVHQEVQRSFDRSVARAKAKGALTSKRHTDIAADLMLSYEWLHQLAVEVGCRDEVTDLFSYKDGLPADIVSIVASGVEANRETSPGRALIEALGMVLRTGYGHILNADDPTIPPLDPATDRARLQQLGWVPVVGKGDNTWQPALRSTTIGWLVLEDDEPVIIFDRKHAFNVAKDHAGGLIPHGQQQKQSWSSVTGEHLGVKGMLRTGPSGAPLHSTRKRTNGSTRTGYPVMLSRILMPHQDAAEQEIGR